MTDRITDIAVGVSEKIKTLKIVFRIPIYLFFWPLILTLSVFRSKFNLLVKYIVAALVILLIQIPWISGIAGMFSSSAPKLTVDQPLEDSESLIEPMVPTGKSESTPIVVVAYQNLTTTCEGRYIAGSLEILNKSNVKVSGRVDVPITTYEKFMIPLSGIFLDVPSESSTVIALEGGAECKKGQKIGEPKIVFTIPSSNSLANVNLKEAFEWSNVSAICDASSGLVKLKATALNVTEFELTAGIQAYLANGPLSEGQKSAGARGTSYFGIIDRLKPGERRVIDFGYGDSCIKGRKGFDGPYFTQFETVFTY